MSDAPSGSAAIESQISQELIRIHEESYGAGVRQATTYFLDDVVLVVLDVELTPAEQTLIDGGSGDAVRGQREAFQKVIGATFTAVVERATGRKVVSFMSHMQMDPIYSVEMFRLAPASRYQTS